jgi:hypothetical protein
MALAFSAPDAELKSGTEASAAPVQSEQTDSGAKRLSSAEIARLIPGQLPDYCEAYAGLDPVTGDQQCEYVICRPPGGFWSLHECSEFGL